ncbi:MAG: hypothetical protein KAR38_11915, partial [Calditrichia bacterium]|nr:hypothetical protein [Calditrichia bacterium]
PAIHSWQILNGKLDNGFLNGQKKWIKALLAGKKIFITAGNDAHGNLNIFRQVKIPFINIENSYLHQFGYFKTGLIHNNFVLNKNNILKLIKQGRMIISSGPFADFSIKINEAIFFIGDTINNENIRNNLSFNLRFHSSPEYGSLFEIRLIYGNLNKKNEKTIFHYENKSQDAIFEYNHSLEFDSNNEFASAYFRIECKTVTGHFVLSNPIWYEK